MSGQMDLPLPPYILTEHDEQGKRINIKVADPTIKHQKAMWG